MNNFFRKDLNLKNRWWHRLLIILFFSSFILFLAFDIALYSSFDMFRGGQVQQWEKVSTLSDRITSEINPISKLIGINEKIGENDRTYVLNDKPDDYYNGILNDVYCSTNLSNNVEKIQENRKIENLFLRDIHGTNNISLENFQKYINENNIQCLIIDAYTKYEPTGEPSGKLRFLEPDISYQNNWSVFKKSLSKTMLYYAEMVLVVFIISLTLFFIILTIYYKIIIYIIFGSHKNS